MNKKAFTLMELLAVIIILGVILTITIYSVNNILDNSENTLSDVQKSNIVEVSKSYYLSEGMNEEYEAGYNNTLCVTVKYLLDKGYIEERGENSNLENTNAYVKITQSSNNKYNYEYKDGNINDVSDTECSIKVDSENQDSE